MPKTLIVGENIKKTKIMKTQLGIIKTAIVNINARLRAGEPIQAEVLDMLIDNWSIDAIHDNVQPDLFQVWVVTAKERGNNNPIMISLQINADMLMNWYKTTDVETAILAFKALSRSERITTIQKMQIWATSRKNARAKISNLEAKKAEIQVDINENLEYLK